MKLILGIALLLISPLLSEDKEDDYVKIYLNLSLGASSQSFHNLLGDGNSLSTTGYHNDISGTVYFDQINKDTKKELFKSVPKKQRKYIEEMSSIDISVKGFIPLISLIPDELSFSKTNDIEHLYMTWKMLGAGMRILGFDIGLTSLYLNDKNEFDKGQFKIRPSLGLWLGFHGLSISKTFPVSFDVYYSWRYLYPSIKFYDDLKFSTITTEPSLTVNLRIPIKIGTDKLLN